MPNVLALDLATQTGWAIYCDGTITSGTVSFKGGRFEGGGMRFLRFKRWLTDVKHNVDGLHEVVYEEVRRHVSTDSAHAYGGFMGTLTSWCEAHEIPYRAVPVGTIKKHATGKGNANKALMVQAAINKGWAPADDNEADALHLLDYVRSDIDVS